MKKNQKNFLILIGCVALCLGIGMLGGLLMGDSIKTWYPAIKRPVFNPPNWVFGPVWTILYILMGVALWLIYISPSKTNKKFAYQIFALQLFVNFIWSGLFFGLKSLTLGLLGSQILWVLIVLTLFTFYKHSKTAAYLLIPYLAWETYAVILLAAIFNLNH